MITTSYFNIDLTLTGTTLRDSIKPSFPFEEEVPLPVLTVAYQYAALRIVTTYLTNKGATADTTIPVSLSCPHQSSDNYSKWAQEQTGIIKFLVDYHRSRFEQLTMRQQLICIENINQLTTDLVQSLSVSEVASKDLVRSIFWRSGPLPDSHTAPLTQGMLNSIKQIAVSKIASANNTLFIANTSRPQISLWDLSTKKISVTDFSPTYPNAGYTHLVSNRRYAAFSREKNAVIAEVWPDRLVHTHSIQNPYTISQLHLTKDLPQPQLFIGSDNGQILTYMLNQHTILYPKSLFAEGIGSITTLNSRQNELYAGISSAGSSRLNVWDINTQQLSAQYINIPSITDIAWHEDNNEVVFFADDQGQLHRRDIREKTIFTHKHGPSTGSSRLAFTTNPNYLIQGNNAIYLFDLRLGRACELKHFNNAHITTIAATTTYCFYSTSLWNSGQIGLSPIL